jgi:cell division protein FtsN
VSVQRDYKPEATWHTRRWLRLHGLLVITLVAVGLFGSLLAYISSRPPPDESVTAGAEADAEATAAATPAAAKPDAAPAVAAPPVTPKYDFYKVLPERRLVIQQNDGPPAGASRPPPLEPARPAPAPARAAATPPRGGVVLQAGTFSSPAEADRRKAAIALLGITAQIETVKASDGSTRHQVRIGPLSDANQAKLLRQRLQEHKIDASPLKE